MLDRTLVVALDHIANIRGSPEASHLTYVGRTDRFDRSTTYSIFAITTTIMGLISPYKNPLGHRFLAIIPFLGLLGDLLTTPRTSTAPIHSIDFSTRTLMVRLYTPVQ